MGLASSKPKVHPVVPKDAFLIDHLDSQTPVYANSSDVISEILRHYNAE